MKTVIALVALLTAGFVGINYVSCYLMGGIEAGLPNGGDGKFADYHDDNLFSYYLSDYDPRYRPSFFSGDDSALQLQGETMANPFVEKTKESTTKIQ